MANPLTLKLEPVLFASEIVLLPVPVLLRVTDRVLLVPTVTLPKLTLVGLRII